MTAGLRMAPIVALALALSGCAGAQSALDPAGDQAAITSDMLTLLLSVCGVMYALVLTFLAAAIWRSRRSLSAAPIADGYESAAERPLQRSLAAWSVLIVVGLFVLGVSSFVVDRRLANAAGRETVHIKITGAQWWWKVEYDDPSPNRRVTTANELHLPVGRRAHIELVADDVIHSFWLPNMAGKQDLIPGRTNQLTITPRRTGLFRGQCAEFCGLEHALMAMDATVESPAQFEAWRRAQLQPAVPPATPQALLGQQIFMNRECSSCHQIQGTQAGGQTGPNLTHLASRRSLGAGALPNDPAQMVAWLHDTQAVKPGAHMPNIPLTTTERDALVAYLRTLK
jgi:cytochrome c oxidase subunit 2